MIPDLTHTLYLIFMEDHLKYPIMKKLNTWLTADLAAPANQAIQNFLRQHLNDHSN